MFQVIINKIDFLLVICIIIYCSNKKDCSYDVIKDVGKNNFNFKLSIDCNEEWDLFWTDNAV
jgi:hypothetical protein